MHFQCLKIVNYFSKLKGNENHVFPQIEFIKQWPIVKYIYFKTKTFIDNSKLKCVITTLSYLIITRATKMTCKISFKSQHRIQNM